MTKVFKKRFATERNSRDEMKGFKGFKCLKFTKYKDRGISELLVMPEGNKSSVDVLNELISKIPSIITPKNDIKIKAENGFTIDEACKKYLEEKVRVLTEKEYKSTERYLAILTHLFGDEDINLSPQKFDELIKICNRMPRGNIKPYNKMTIQQRIELAYANKVPLQAQMTNSKHANKAYQGLFNWLVKSYYLDESPANKRRVDLKQGGERAGFDFHEAQVIVDYAHNCNDLNLKWSILIMAYTGMRNGEIERLRVHDIKQCKTTNIWYFNIRESKTKAGIRKIPIAEILIQLGILDFANSRCGETLFSVSKRYMTTQYSNKIKRACNLPDRNEKGEVLNLYSFRHTVTSIIRATGAREFHSMAIMGHSGTQSVHNKYSHKKFIPLDKLKEFIDCIANYYQPKVLK